MSADPVLILHTTEGTSIEGAKQTMLQNGTQCHEIVDPSKPDGEGWPAKFQVIDWSKPARSLRHPTGTPETNNRGYTPATSHLGRVYQIEIVGRAGDGHPPAWWAILAKHLTHRCKQLGVPIGFPYRFGGVEGYGVDGKYRLNWSLWTQASGILGHCHVPGNKHWDPGPIQPLIERMTGGGPVVESEIRLPANRDATIRRIQRTAGVEEDGDPYIKTAEGVERLLARVIAQDSELEDVRNELSAAADVQIELRNQVYELQGELARWEEAEVSPALGWPAFMSAVHMAIEEME